MTISFEQQPGLTLSVIETVIWRCNECGAEWHEGYTERVWGEGDPPRHVTSFHHYSERPQHKPGCPLAE